LKYGIGLFATAEIGTPQQVARDIEQRGFESVWLSEHTHEPVTREMGHNKPPEFWRAFDPFVALAAMAVASERLMLATGVLQLIERDPIIVAKETASLDHVSGGRAILGVGFGWLREAMANHGTEYRTRFMLVEEQVTAMKAMWTSDAAEFHGKLVDFAPLNMNPKPVQRPYPPVYIGAKGERGIEALVRVGDGWMPLASEEEWPDIRDAVPGIVDRMRAAGRTLDRLPLTMFTGGVPSAAAIADMAAHGVERIVLDVSSMDRGEYLGELDSLAAKIA